MDTPPVTPTSVKEWNSAQSQSTPYVDSSANASTGTRKHVRSRLEQEIGDKYIDGLPFDIFIEDYLQSPGIFCWALFCRLMTYPMPGVDNAFSIEELKAYEGLLELSEGGNPAIKKTPPTSRNEASLLP